MPRTLTDQEIDAFRQRLCDAAETLFAANGPAAVTMRELADAVGASPMTPYRYFKDKDEILAMVRARAFNRFADTIERFDARMRRTAKAPSGGKMTRAFLWARTDAYMTFALANTGAYRLMFDVNQPTADLYPELVAARERARQTLAPSMGGRAGSGAALAAHMLWSESHGAVMLELAGMLRPPLTARTIVRPALEAIAEKLGILD